MKTPEELFKRYLDHLGREQDNQIVGSPGIGAGSYNADECKRLALARLVSEEVESARAEEREACRSDLSRTLTEMLDAGPDAYDHNRQSAMVRLANGTLSAIRARAAGGE